jgi:hypothetical protein
LEVIAMAITIDGRSYDEISVAEAALEELASRVPSPNGAADIEAVIAGLFAWRCGDTYAGFLGVLPGRSMVAPTILARPLVEGAITLRWIRDDPDLRFKMWVAHSEEMDTKAIRELAQHLPRPAGDPYAIDALRAVLDEKDARADAARTASGRTTPPRLLPGLTEMIEAVRKADAGEAHALYQAYDLAFRSISPATHNDASSFSLSLTEEADGTVSFAPAPPIDPERLRFIAAACVAYTLESCGRLARNSEIEQTALKIRGLLAAPPDGSAESPA